MVQRGYLSNMKKKILFRGDGNDKIGLGHLYRLYAMAEMIKGSHKFIFVTREDSLTSFLPKEYQVDRIPATKNYKEEVQELIQKYTPSECLMIVDGYSFDSQYQKRIKQAGFTLVYIDDLAKEHMYADLVINHSPFFEKKDFSSEPYTQFALGLKYSIIRPLFIQACKAKRKINQINSAFICFGGADMYNLTEKSIKALLNTGLFRTINVVVGAANHSNLDSFSSQEIKIHKNLSESEMIELLFMSNFAIVPSSTILYEVCAVKMPVLSGYFVDNQKSIYEGFLKNKMIMGIGDFRIMNTDDIQQKVNTIFKHENFKDLVENQYYMMDGEIKERFLKLIKYLC